MKQFRIDMSSEGKGALEALLFLLFDQQGYVGARRDGSKKGIGHIAVREPAGDKPRRLVFYWSGNGSAKDLTELPTILDAQGAAYFANDWLERCDYGPEEDTDGHCNKGWRVYNEAWGHVDNDPYAFLAIAPEWIEYGK